MRKIGIGTAGDPLLGRTKVDDNIFTTILSDEDLVLDPNGAGEVKVNGNVQINNTALMKFGDADNSNWTALKGASTVASNLTFTLPDGYGTNGQLLQTNGSGGLSWGSPGITITNDTATTNNNLYLAFTASSSGTVSSLSVSNNKLAYQPSTGNLFVGIVSGGEGNGNNLVLRSTSAGTKGQVYIDENTTSTSTTTGALRVSGGVGIAGNTYIGGSLSAQAITETSSITLKENINPIENALQSLTQLVGVVYDRKDGSSKNEAGLIAEEVNKVLPNLVHKDEQGNPQSIQYTKLSAYIIEALKTLKDEIDNLKKG